MALTRASWDGDNRGGYGDDYDYFWVMEQVRAIEAEMNRDKKLLRKLKKEVAELKREVQRYKEQLDAMQQMNKGKMVLGMVAEVLPVPDSIRTTLSRLIDLI
jgi:molecular chaperone GrpE (heat shock protein)